MYRLKCSAQNYAWGKVGAESEVANLLASSQEATQVDNAKRYAELWMGVHPNGPSVVASTGVPLADVIRDQKGAVAEHEYGTLQFLFKVLSVDKALSVQSHPTKEQAVVLHANDPKNYPDDNHKPEMAIALTDFQLLCGFRVAKEIYDNIMGSPELISLLGESRSVLGDLLSESADAQHSALRILFTTIWSQTQERISHAVASLIQRLKAGPKNELNDLIIRLDNEFPGGDVGVFAPLLLNYFTLKPGEATFLGPNQPHAYLLGDCIECMACSDNTIRAGLTPKFKDINTLCTSLEYTMSPPPYFKTEIGQTAGKIYDPPVPEFAVQEIKASSCTPLSNVSASSLLIVVRGSATFVSDDGKQQAVQRGDVIFLSANLDKITGQNVSEDFLAFRAYTPRK